MSWGSALRQAARTVDGPAWAASEGTGQIAALVADTDASELLEKDSVGQILAVPADGVAMKSEGIAGPFGGPEASSAAERAVELGTAAGSAKVHTEKNWPGALGRDERSEEKSTVRPGSHASPLELGRRPAAEVRSGGGPRACESGNAAVPCSPRLPD